MRSLRVLITRPRHQAGSFAERVRRAGHQPLRCPTLHIDTLDTARVREPAPEPDTSCDIAIFVSVNAVLCAEQIKPLRDQLAGVRAVLAVGPATTSALRARGIAVTHHDSGAHDSEALLKSPVLRDIAGTCVYLFKGHGGRTLIADTLIDRGATLVPCVVYQRRAPSASEIEHSLPGVLLADVIQSGSDEALDNLVTLTPTSMRDQLFNTALIVNSERGKRHAETLGFSARIHVAHPAGDDGQLAALARLAIPETTRQ